MPGRARPRKTVPSEDWPTLAQAIAGSPGGAAITILPGHYEELESLLLDQPFELDGPADWSATLVVEQGIVCSNASNGSGHCLALRNLTLRSAHANVLTLSGPCLVEFCDISGGCVGVHLSPPASQGHQTCLAQSIIHGCEAGLCFSAARGLAHVQLHGNRVERNACGAVIVGLELTEGSSPSLQPLAGTRFADNTRADVQLVAIAVRRPNSAVVRASALLDIKQFEQPCVLTARTEDAGGMLLRADREFTEVITADTDQDAWVTLAGVGTLPLRGRWRTSPLALQGKGLAERRRDFARLAVGAEALFVIPPQAAPPQAWRWPREETTSENGYPRPPAVTAHAGNVNAEVCNAAAADLAAWLAEVLADSRCALLHDLGDRCIALLGAGEGVSFALAHGLTPALTQPRFILLASQTGEVRIAWLFFVSGQSRPREFACCLGSRPKEVAGSSLYLVRALSSNLNDPDTAVDVSKGVWMEFAVEVTDEFDMAQIVARNTGKLRRAVDECNWSLVLAAD